MIKRFSMILGLIIGIAAVGAFSRDAKISDPTDAKSFIARETARGAPNETTGLNSTVLGAISLEAYSESLKNGNFRAREVMLQPGAKIGIHAHDGHPAIVHVLQGEVLEHRSDSDVPLIRRAGDTYFEGPAVAHWLENISSEPVRAFSVDIVPDEVE